MIGLQAASDPAPTDRWRRLVPAIFAQKGWLSAGLGLDHRPQQESLALQVAGCLQREDTLLIEAGTGVGKSLGYLLPGILRAVDEQRKLVVSTHTISLQEQLDRKDLPLCRKLFRAAPALQPYAEFKHTLLVGKGNYLCRTRLARAQQERADLLQPLEHPELQRIAEWAASTTTGLRHELNPPPASEVWELVNADSSVCSRRNCNPDTCPYQAARRRVEDADVVIVNHSLFFALLRSADPDKRREDADSDEPVRGILFPDDNIVFDEAHTVPEVATQHLGFTLSSFGLQRLLQTLYNPNRDRGLLKKRGPGAACEAVGEALIAATYFFSDLCSGPLARQTVVRVRGPDTVAPALDAPLRKVLQHLESAVGDLEDGPARDELKDQQKRLADWRACLLQFCSGPDEDSVFWMERTGRRQDIVSLRSAPLEVAGLLRELVFSRSTAAVLTSATLSGGADIASFAAEIGAPGASCERLDSPFDFARSMAVNIAEDMPEHTADQRRLDQDWLFDSIEWCLSAVPGGCLVLFTSQSDLTAVFHRMKPVARSLGRSLFAQGQDLSRTEITERFAAAKNGILLGTDSFWTGVDVPGPALQQVILTRLPFEFPNHPIPEARAERVRQRGGNPFAELQLPAAVRMFRQGIGRLIRSADDCGVITLLDSRVLTKSYGKRFLEALPSRRIHRFSRATREVAFRLPERLR